MEENEKKENTSAEEIQKNPMPKWKKRTIKWGSIIAVVFLCLLFAPGIIVSHVVPPIASQILKVKVEIGSAFINIFDGAVRIKNMKVHNPEGYTAPYAFELGHFYVDLKMLTLASPKIEIADIIIEDMHATLELKLGTNNLEDISKGLQKPDDGKKKEKEEPAKDTSKPEKEPPKMVIRHFKIAKSDFTMLKVPWPIPSMELTDVGDGRPITEFVAVVYDAILDCVVQAAKAVGKGVDNIGKGLSDAAKSTGDVVNNAGKAINDAGKSLKNIFSK